MTRTNRGEVAIVMPMFSPPRESIERLRGVASQVERVIVVDDNPDEKRDWADVASMAPNIEVIQHVSNLGIAAALNTGIRHVLDDAKIGYVITLDQDSELPADYVATFVRGQAEKTRNGQKIGILCPRNMDSQPVAVRQKANEEPYDPMQSGMFIPTSTFSEVGLFDESLFIDAVDSDFALRTRRRGLSVEFVPGTDLRHGLGNQIPAALFGKSLKWRGGTKFFASHSATRLYYITRNHLIVNLRFIGFDPGWVMRRFYEDIKLIGINIAFGPGKSKMWLAVSTGFIHGILHRTGKISPKLAQRLISRD